MRQPSPTPVRATSSAAPPAPAPTATESVTRPDPGLARGKWEAPVWVFWVILAIVIVGSAAYLLRRLGLLRIAREKPRTPSIPPTSGGRRR